MRADIKQNRKTNSFYLLEDRRENVKDYFKLILKTIRERDPNFSSLIDVGCATGDFLHYVSKNICDRTYIGIDNFAELLDVARSRILQGSFFLADINNTEELPDLKADLVCMSGVLYLFDDFRTPLKNLLNMTNEGGVVYCFSTFNKNGCNVEHKFWNEDTNGHFMEWSTKTIGNWLSDNGYKYEFIPFALHTEIEKTDDPIRTWTVPLKNDKLGVINGLNIWHDFYLLRIEKR